MEEQTNAARVETAEITRPFWIGEVLGKSWGALKSSPLTYLGLALIAVLPPLVLFPLLFSGSVGGFSSGFDSSRFLGSAVSSVLLDRFFYLIVQGAAAFAVYRNLTGRGASFGESLLQGASRIFATIGTSLLINLVMFLLCTLALMLLGSRIFGLIVVLFIVLNIVTRWAVAVPVCVVEHIGPFKSVTRSSELTEGNRFKVLAILIVLSIPEKIVSKISAAVIVSSMFQTSSFSSYCTLLVTVPLTAYQIVANAVIYYELRASKENIDIESLANVFD